MCVVVIMLRFMMVHGECDISVSLVRELKPKCADYRGLGAATMRVVPMACVSFGTYEVVHAWLARLDGPQGPVLAPLSALDACCGTIDLEDGL